MPFNPDGSFDPLPPPIFPAVPGTVIRSDYYNQQIQDICDGISEVATGGEVDVVQRSPLATAVTEGQTDFAYSFTTPVTGEALLVLVDGGIADPTDYTFPGAGVVRFTTGRALGTQVAVISLGAIDGAGGSPFVTRTELAASGGAALVGTVAAGAGSVPRTVESKLRDITSVFDVFTEAQKADVSSRAKTLNVSAAFAIALSSLQAAGGGALWLPPGGYLAPTINTVDGASYRIIGSGQQNTTLWTNSATASVLDLIAWNSSIENVGFDSTVTRTAGNYLSLTGAFTSAQFCQFNNDYTGVYMTGVNAKILYCTFRTGASGGSRIVVDGGDTSQLIHGCLLGSQSAPYPLAGIRVKNSSALTISDTSIIHQGADLLINPGNGEFCYSLYASNMICDTATNGVYIIPSGTGIVQRLQFVSCWTSSHTDSGFKVVKGGSVNITGLRLVNHQAHLNGDNGISLATAGVVDFRVLGGAMAQNLNSGIYVEDGNNDFSIQMATAGACDGLNGNGQRGITVGGTSHDRYSITGNTTIGNTVGQILDQGTGTTKLVFGNLGYNPTATAAATVGASPWTYTNNTGAPVVLAVYGGTVSSVVANGRQIATATNCQAIVPHGKTAVVTYSVLPNVEISGLQ